MDLRNKLALVTGGSDGIGREIALQLQGAGADVIVTGRSAKKLQAMAALGFGTIAGDLTVEPGSRAIIHGTVAGRIYNKGGRVEMFGMADSVENLAPDAATIIDAAAHILRGRRLETVR